MLSQRFASLFNFHGKKAGKKSEEEECKPREGESDEEFASRMKKMEFKDDDDRKQGKEESDSDYATRMSAREDDEEEEEDDEKRGEEEKEKEKAAAYSKGFKAGGERWATVLSSKAAAGRGMTACSLLADTEMTAPQIVKALSGMPVEKQGTALATRMAQVAAATPTVESEGERPAAGDVKSIASAMVKAADKARGKAA